MPKMQLNYRVVEIPPARRDTHNYLDLYWWKHSIYALLEVDVTSARISSRSTKRGRAKHYRLPATWPSASGAQWMRTSRCRRTRRVVSTW